MPRLSKLMRKLVVFVVISGFFSASVPGWAQDGQSAQPAESSSAQVVTEADSAPQADAQIAAADSSPTEVVTTNGENVSLDFKDADIKNVLKILAIKSGFNIITTPNVQGLVTVQLNEVPWHEALSVILSTYGYAYEQKGNIIIVSTVEDLKKRRDDAVTLAEQEPLVTKTFTVNFAKAESIVESLKKLASSRGNINFDQRTNMLIVTDIAARMDQIQEAIKELDAVTPQILIEGQVIETDYSNKDNLGVNWTLGGTVQAAGRPITWPFRSSTHYPYASSDAFPGAEDTDFTYGTLDFSDLKAVFEILKTRSNTNIISSPRIVTQNNQAAKINVGQQYPIPSYTYNEQQGSLQISGWEYKDIGVIFEVTPYANNAGFVTMKVKPQISSFTDTVTVENTSLPLINNQSAETQVMVKDGETLVIAGLITTNKVKTKNQVPVLGSIPIVGYLFKKKAETDAKNDLMVFLTPHIITPKLETAAVP